MSFLSLAPWGSPTVASIPLPPFGTEAEHRRFTRMLQLHLALIDPGGPALPTLALSLELDEGLPRRRFNGPDPEPLPDGDPRSQLTRLELATALSTWFPAPWTPESLAAVLRRALGPGPARRGEAWRWGSDPDFSASPAAGGSWRIIRHERGSRTETSVRDDRDLVVLWLSHFRSRFTVPWGAKYSGQEADERALAPASLAVLRADIIDAGLPYRADWMEHRAELFAAADDPSRPAQS